MSERTIPSVNPATGETLVQIADCGTEDVNLAVGSARKAFESGVWKDRSPSERKEVLLRFADLLDANLEELALLETLETGKPIKDSRTVDIPKSANMIRWYAEAIDKQYDEVAPTGSTTLSYVTREPLGVVGAVVPWNFPLYLAAYKLGPALATGNSIVVKPAEQSSLTTLRAAELAVEAGLPKGVFNVVTGTGPETGKALGLHMDVDVIAFTGSPQIARAFLVYAGQSNMKKVQLEAGGKSPNIIMADTTDLDRAATQAAWGIFYNQGQVCSAGSRLLVERPIHDDFIAKVVEITKTMVVGDPLNPETQIGALIDANHLSCVMEYFSLGQKEGATLALGGHRTLEDTGGAFFEPTIFADVRNDMRIAQEEIFGPVLSVINFNGLEEAIQIANDSDYGLGAAIWSSSIDTALSAANRLRAGQVWVNNFDGSDLSVPWGGFKQSGTGRDKSLHAFDEYTGLKATWVELGAG
jgi:gamma-glutamyl-gamma-aminobutyraldehyde dehydrogenase/4-guanidinobutyraldehyde dehydrogenase/NAD-dependent aldehyde dehydrogenase